MSAHATILEFFATKGHLTSSTPAPQHLHSTKESGEAPKQGFLRYSINPAGMTFRSSCFQTILVL